MRFDPNDARPRRRRPLRHAAPPAALACVPLIAVASLAGRGRAAGRAAGEAVQPTLEGALRSLSQEENQAALATGT